VAGPAARKPQLVKTILGASTQELAAGEIRTDLASEVRVISGSVLSGRKATAPQDFLGRYDLALTFVEEGRRRELLGWAGPGFKKFSVKPVFVSALANEKKFAMTTSTEGSPRAIVPIGSYEKVMPLDIVIVPLLKALVMEDHDMAQTLGCLELAEEDVALASFVDPGKHEFGPLLRRTLDYIEAEG
jgi:Na+-transporting NADH:ubiquinone oxidoreductase subunit A